MSKKKDTWHFIEISLDSLEIVRVGTDHSDALDRGQQKQEGIHRLFISKGQFNKFVDRCEADLQHVLDT